MVSDTKYLSDISEVLWYSYEINFTVSAQAIILYD